MSRELVAAIRALPQTAWPSAGVAATGRPAPPRCLAIRVGKRQGGLFADGSAARHLAIVANLPDPEGGSGLDLIRWRRGKAGTVEHAHHLLTNGLAAEALPAQIFAASAARLRLAPPQRAGVLPCRAETLCLKQAPWRPL